jgi:hypothetical protein
VNVDVENGDLQEVLDQLAACVGWRIDLLPGGAETVSVKLHDVPWRDAVEAIAELAWCKVEHLEDGTLVSPIVIDLPAEGMVPVAKVLTVLADRQGKQPLLHESLEDTAILVLSKDARAAELVGDIELDTGAVIAAGEDWLYCGPPEWVAKKLAGEAR